MKPASDTRKPYGGTTRSLVIALDVGTTFSGVSYAILEPGEVPKIHGVTRFPGQEHVAGNSKIPSVMYYDRRGKMMAAGAEAESAAVLAQAEDDGWIKVELFKLRLRPKTMKLQMNGMQLGPLPRGKNAVDLFGDFLGYLFRCTRVFIIDTHANGQALWNAVEAEMQFVLSHPNGWEGAQQSKMRRAAIYGGLIPNTDEGKSRIRFVTEGEASLHACVLNGLAADVLSSPSRHGFLVADAGGGTLDISSYAIRGTVPLVIEEIAPPDCVFSGSVFVSRRAHAFLEEKLKTSKYGTPDAVDHITKRFDETTKRLFRDKKDLQFIPFGSPLDKDMSVGIRGGQLKLTGNEVADLFEPSVASAVASIRAQIEASQGIVKSVWLVGGFAASPWLFNQLQERLAPLGVTVSRPDSQTSKAVADGAIGFYSDHHVSARMSKFMYGVEFLREYDPRDQEHLSRRNRLCELPSGPRLLPDAFDCILARSVKVKESTVFSRKYCTELTSLSTLSVFEVEIWCYRGGDSIPQWILRQAEEFSTLCVVRADLSPLSGSAQAKQSRNGKTYWTIVFSVEIHFGLTEFKARIKWVDKDKTRYGPASIVYNEGGSRADEEDFDDAAEDGYAPQARSRNVSRGQSPASFAPPPINSKAIDFPRAEPMSAAPSTGGFERERPSSRGMPGPSSASLAPGMSRRNSAQSTEPFIPPKPAEKGKERERSIYAPSERPGYPPSGPPSGYAPSGYAPSSYAPSERDRDRTSSFATDRSMAHSRNTSTTSRLGDTLTNTWGNSKASPIESPVSPYIPPEPSVPPTPATRDVPKIDTSSRPTSRYESKVNTPRERTSSRVSERGLSMGADPLAPEPPVLESVSEAPPAPAEEPPIEEAPPVDFSAPPADVGADDSWADPPPPPAPVEPPVEEPAPAPVKKGKKGKTTASKAASKAATPAASKVATPAPTPAPKTPVERTRSNDWASLSATAPEPVPESPAVGAEFSSFEDTFQLQDFTAKDKAKVITPTFDMSTPAEEAPPPRTKSIFGAITPSKPASPPAAETGSSWGGFGGLGSAIKSFGFGGSGGSATSGGAKEPAKEASGGWGIGSSLDNKEPAAAAAGGDWFNPSGIEATTPGQHDLSSALGLGGPKSADVDKGFSFGNPESAPLAQESAAPAPEAPPAEELGPNGKPLSKVMLRKRQKEREAKEKAEREAKEQEEAEQAAQEQEEAAQAAQEQDERAAEEQHLGSTLGDEPTTGEGGWEAPATEEPAPQEEDWSSLTPKERKKKEKEKAEKERAARELEEQVQQQLADEAAAAEDVARQQGTEEVPGGWGSGGGGDWGTAGEQETYTGGEETGGYAGGEESGGYTGGNTGGDSGWPEDNNDNDFGSFGAPKVTKAGSKKKGKAARQAEEQAANDAWPGNEADPLGAGDGGAATEPAADIDPLNDPAWDRLTPKERKKKQKEAKDRIEREQREKELADFMAEQDAELNPASAAPADSGGLADDMADLMGAEAPLPVPEKKEEEDDAWGAPKKAKKGGGKKGKK